MKKSFNSINDNILPSQINLRSFIEKPTLNPKLWENGHLKPNISKTLKKLAKEFVDQLGIDLKYSDLVLIGSNASYHWSKYSDIDLHIVVDYKKVSKDHDLVLAYFKSIKSVWDEKHSNITIFGYPVEIYIQEQNEENQTEGIYSILKDEWIKKPKIRKSNINQKEVCQKASKYINEIDDYVEMAQQLPKKELQNFYTTINAFYKSIIKSRRKGLQQDGEDATDNIVFKVLRRTGHLKKLLDLKNRLYDRNNSLNEIFNFLLR